MSVLFVDLDGTIIDPAPGIIASYSHTLTRLGLACPPPERIRALIGPPLRRSMPHFLPLGHDIEEAVRLYREHYGAVGMLDASLYPGIEEALENLRADGARLFVCTSKATRFATPILEHFRVAHFFEGVYGADLEGRFDDKADLIGHMLVDAGVDQDETVMIGDRAIDVHAAGRHGIPTVGVLWGYGGRLELLEAGATAIAAAPSELSAAIAMSRRATPSQ